MSRRGESLIADDVLSLQILEEMTQHDFEIDKYRRREQKIRSINQWLVLVNNKPELLDKLEICLDDYALKIT